MKFSMVKERSSQSRFCRSSSQKGEERDADCYAECYAVMTSPMSAASLTSRNQGAEKRERRVSERCVGALVRWCSFALYDRMRVENDSAACFREVRRAQGRARAEGGARVLDRGSLQREFCCYRTVPHRVLQYFSSPKSKGSERASGDVSFPWQRLWMNGDGEKECEM